MIETLGQTFCRECGKTIVLPARQGPHIREFCNGTCRKRWHRKHPQPARGNATIDTMEAESRIAELERQVKDLQARLESEADTRVREFKIWLRSHSQPTDTTFFKRFLDDRDMPSKASQSMYLARLRIRQYSGEDIELFKDAWKRMLFSTL